jgi:uncharacterized protein
LVTPLFTSVADGLVVALKVTPRARRAGVMGVRADGDGVPMLLVSVNTPPEDGKANAAVIALLAESWDVPRSCLSIISGATDRRKRLHVADGTPALRTRLEDWRRALWPDT